MNGNRIRVSIQVPPDLFEAMDKKRFEDKASFQEVGERLFRQWLGEEPPEVTNDEKMACDKLLHLMRNRDKLTPTEGRILDNFLFESAYVVARLCTAKDPGEKDRA